MNQTYQSKSKTAKTFLELIVKIKKFAIVQQSFNQSHPFNRREQSHLSQDELESEYQHPNEYDSFKNDHDNTYNLIQLASHYQERIQTRHNYFQAQRPTTL